MAKLSIVIPSRDEVFLTQTIHDIFRNARGEIEVVAVLDSDRWPDNWKSVTDAYPNLHTIFHGQSFGMRRSINDGVASAKSRGAKYVMKSDGHCAFDEGFDIKLLETIEPNWIVIPRRKRLDAEHWTLTDTHKPDVDYHYLSFPDDPNDFGGPGLNGKIWPERAVARKDILIDDEMSSQGSAWLTSIDYFYELDLMDEQSYGPFWCEAQELLLKCWLSGGRGVINKHAWYAHLHKGTKYGRGYRLSESWLTQGRNHTMRWPWNEAWDKQTLPFSWLIEHFWPVPTWPENWEEMLYTNRKPALVSGWDSNRNTTGLVSGEQIGESESSLIIHSAHYGIGNDSPDQYIDVRERLQSLVTDSALDIIVNNSTLTPNQNPFRGQRKHLRLDYSIDGGEVITRRVEEKEWLIIGPVEQCEPGWAGGGGIGREGGGEVDLTPVAADVQHQSPKFDTLMKVLAKEGESGYFAGTQPALGSKASAEFIAKRDSREDDVRPVVDESKRLFHEAVTTEKDDDNVEAGHNMVRAAVGMYLDSLDQGYKESLTVTDNPPRTAAALNDYLIRRFSISPQRLRGPMPIELRDFHRNDLAQLFAELGFQRGAEIGVAEGNYSEVLLKANPECELLLVDPWHHYSDNPQGKSKEKHEFALNEVRRKVAGYRTLFFQETSMEAVREIPDVPLDFVYIDGNHLFDYVIQDLVEWSKRVRSGGIISGDDYYALDQKRWVGGGVVEAVQAYTNAHRIPIWWLFAGHKSVDFMWVKP